MATISPVEQFVNNLLQVAPTVYGVDSPDVHHNPCVLRIPATSQSTDGLSAPTFRYVNVVNTIGDDTGLFDIDIVQIDDSVPEEIGHK
jgi:hypothetical protein